MKINTRLTRLLSKTLAMSTEPTTMVRMIRKIVPFYDINTQSGYPPNIPVPTQDAANQITADVIAGGHFVTFVKILIDVYQNGLMGRKIQFSGLNPLLKEMEKLGLVYNHQTREFEERTGQQRTRNWGVLQEGQTYEFTFLRLDIVGNTQLVRKYPRKTILTTYNTIKELVQRIVEKRNGRIWEWEGDGGYAAFYYKDKNIKAVLSGMEILYELLLYNLFECPLNTPLQVRMAIHTGPCPFYTEPEKLQNETLKTLELLESQYSSPDSLTLSPGVFSDLGGKMEKAFTQETYSAGNHVYTYKLKWEE